MVMWINVSAGESNENLDMSQLKVDREGANDSDNIAERISNELNGKRYLLLLDDIKANLDIHQMGIPPCENGSKIVLTTRENQIHFPRVKFLKLTPLPTNQLQFDAWQSKGSTGRPFKSSILIVHVAVSIGCYEI
ncbi:hypothetical protein HYC85_009907 [Camellia sinensis]|uniref:NB-ARC domain-containing protein n=1 Tax=Camellia sinensis TaxID=4442 RepID=A0A7J7HGF9_CAMSI|nr:hypothetical protein HYC85_009907 [Camellia sinensis]